MLTNLLRPWVLARLLSGAAALALVLYGAFVASKVLRFWRVGTSTEGQLALERRAELVAAIVQVALAVAVVNLALTVLTADRLTESIRGAMCAYGVLDASPYGFAALSLSALAAAGCALWVVLHRLDLSLASPALTRRKFAGLFLLAPLLTLDLYATTRWTLDLDMQVVASCCSVGLDAALGAGSAAGAGPHGTSAIVGLVAVLGAALTATWAWRRPGRSAALTAALASALGLAAALPAILWYVAPHAYETPHHLCPFCLLHADVYGIGWPLFGALFGATVAGLGLGLVEAQRGASHDGAAVGALERRLGRAAAIGWLLTLALGAFPVVRFAVVSGGASLFGGPA